VRVRLVHGFTQTSRSWDAVVPRLPPDWDVEPIELPDGLDFVATADTLGIRSGAATWVGYSLGGRLCLRLALDRPSVVERLVLISATPGVTGPAARETRRAADERLAQSAERDGVKAFMEAWLAQPLFQTLPAGGGQLEIRVRHNTVLRITHQLRVLGQAAHEPMWDQLSRLEMPVLIITGAYDRKYAEVGVRMGAAIGANATVVTIPKAGHAIHLERPRELADVITSWVNGEPLPSSGSE
jgi:2-succinyl-6-hydroxy-2,4-cyclohexadiene-1-carboxylate synthase